MWRTRPRTGPSGIRAWVQKLGPSTSRAALLRELDEVRECDYGYDRDEPHEGITAIGVALRDPLGPLVAIIVPIPTQRFPKVETRAIEALLETQRRCQALLGDAPGEPRR